MVEQEKTENVILKLSKSKKGLCVIMGNQMFFTSTKQTQKLLDGKVDAVKLRKGNRNDTKTKGNNQN